MGRFTTTILFTTLLSLAFSVLPLGAAAQPALLFQTISLNASPPTPAPGETFAVMASTPTIDKNRADFSWIVNGKFRSDLSGQGKNTISLIAGALGSLSNVAVEVTKPGGGTLSAETAIRTADLSLTWFAETHTPKWYKGKALPSQRSVVSIVATPSFVINNSTVRPENLIYRWGMDDDDDVLSGTGQRVFRVFTPDTPKSSVEVRVTVEDRDGRVRKEGRVFISPTSPTVVLYRLAPLGGIETRSAIYSGSALPRGTLDLVAEPFFFPVFSKRDLSYQWSANGVTSAGSPDNSDILTLNTNENTGDNVLISLVVDDKNPYISSVTKAVSLFLR